jgi:peptidoglycan hydrolase-like protein with peptidoglycan-binding domain
MRGKIKWASIVFVVGGLLVTGIVLTWSTGPTVRDATLTAASMSVSTANIDNCPILAEGYTGGCAAQLQTELNDDDNAGLTADGTFGPATQQAVIAFQQQNNIVPADGIVGSQTKAALDNFGSGSVPTPELSSPQCSENATQGPPSASIPPSQQSYFQCQPPGQPGTAPDVTGCLIAGAGGLVGVALPGAAPLEAALAGLTGLAGVAAGC